MDGLAIPIKLFLSFVIGSVIGLEREINEKKVINGKNKPVAVLGLRSFALISVMGALSGILYKDFLPLAFLFSAAFLVLVVVFYYLDSVVTRDNGITTELAIIYSFIIGLLITLNVLPIQVILAITVLVLLLLSHKVTIKGVVSGIESTELNAFISYAIIALVILPFLPNMSYALADIPLIKDILSSNGGNISKLLAINFFNPFNLWLIVALVTGVDFIGYILERVIGQKKGWLLASAAGGFVSSTATTQSLAQESKYVKSVNHLVAAAILSNIVSFFQIAALIAPLNPHFITRLLPVLLFMILVGAALLVYFLRKKEKEVKKGTDKLVKKDKGIFDLWGALKFAGLFLVISIVTKIALSLFGQSGFLVATGIGALIGLDAVVINTAQLAGKNFDFMLAVLAFILANFVNLTAKSFYSYLMGNREFATKFTLSMIGIIAASLVGLLFVR